MVLMRACKHNGNLREIPILLYIGSKAEWYVLHIDCHMAHFCCRTVVKSVFTSLPLVR